MERFIADLVKDFESGKIDRRKFCETVAVAAVVFAAGEGAANAAPARGFQPLAINNISYSCADYRSARDFYSSVFGMQNAVAKEGNGQARLMFGSEPGMGGTFLHLKNGPTTSNATAFIDHICYTIPNWSEDNVRNGLTALGLEITGRPGSLHVYDPNDFDIQIANSIEENGFR
jgi:catechol 2,3-dioxygenase-like lactoylglutathione lyase family enzyme